MFLVLRALRRPVTVIVAALAILLGAALAVRQAPVDIFPDLRVPVIYVVQPYGGMSPSQMEGQLISYYEYHFLYIAGIEHIESQSIQGMGMLKLYFHPGTDIAQAMALVPNPAGARAHRQMDRRPRLLARPSIRIATPATLDGFPLPGALQCPPPRFEPPSPRLSCASSRSARMMRNI